MRISGRATILVLVLVLASGACAGRGGPGFPAPGWERGGVPDMRGARVILFPLQDRGEGTPDVDPELAYAFQQRGPEVEWRDAAALEEVAGSSGRLGADPHSLTVGTFRAGEVQRVGDPLFGELYRLGSFVDADLVVLPLGAAWQPEEEGGRPLALRAALVVPRNGRVLWQGIVQGAPGDPASPAPVASAAEALAARLLP